MPQGRPSVRHAARRHQRLGRPGSTRCSQPRRRSWSTRTATSRSSPTPMKQVLEWFKKLVPFLPPDVFAWDDARTTSALISGQARADLQPALGLGGGGARRAEGRRADAGPSRRRRGRRAASTPAHAVLLGHLELLAEQGGGEEPADLSVPAAPRSSRPSRRARATTSRPSPSCTTSRPGPRKGRRRAASTTTRRAAT